MQREPGQTDAEKHPLPALRPELNLLRGAPTREGDAGWLIYDPVQHRYVQIDQSSYELLSIWQDCNEIDDLIDAAQGKFGSKFNREQIERFIAFLEEGCLTVEAPKGGWRYYSNSAESRANANGALAQLAHRYLFFRVPLWRPQRFLTATMPLVEPLYSRSFALLIGLLGLIGLYLTSRQWDDFVRTTDFLFSWEGLLWFGLSLVVVKALHELGHAFTAVRYGCFVPTMGVAFMLLTPLLYTDVTDAWKLRQRRQRLAIDTAGIVVELGIACIATFVWAFLPEGPVRSAAFLLATAGWIMSLAINLNPFMRFDGYYILAELIGIENLQSRAFVLGRWRMREILFKLNHPCPESFSRRMVNGLIVWAWCTWIYRLALFIGIALLVYTYCFKALGVALFLLEIVFLVAKPVWSEFKTWFEMRKEIAVSRRTLATACATCALIILAVIPWSGSVSIPAVVQSAQTQPIHAVRPAQIVERHVEAGQRVRKGDKLFSLRSGELDNQVALARTELKLIKLRLGRRNVDRVDREESLVLQRQSLALKGKIAGLLAQRRELVLRAPATGVVLELDREAHAGRWVKPSQQLALIGEPQRLEATGYAAEEDVWRISSGTTGSFVPDAALAPAIDVRLRDIAVTGSPNLDVTSLASVFGGPIAVERNSDGNLVPVRAQYQVRLDLLEPLQDHRTESRGVIQLAGNPESLLARFWRRALNVLIRESGA
ncbi:MAG: HlyD family efflux transporter periplasmic adaptor subunit [Hyphomicrobiaceae bacterium]